MYKFLFSILLWSSFLFSQEKKTTLVSIKKELIETGRQAYFNKNRPLLLGTTTKIDSLYKITKDSLLLAKYYHFKALQHKLTYTNDSSFYFYQLSKDISRKIKDSLATGRRLLSIAMLQKNTKDYLGSEISSVEALQYLEPIKSYKYLESIYNNLGLVSQELNNTDDAYKSYQEALSNNKKTKKSARKSATFLYIINNLGLFFQKKTENKKAITYFKQGLAFDSIKNKYPIQYTLLLENLAFSNYQLGKKTNTLNQYEEVLTIRKENNNFSYTSSAHINISNYYKDLNQNKKALYHANQALKYAKQTHNNKKWLEALENLSELSKSEQAKKYLKEYIYLNDSLFEKERRLKNQFAKIRYETDKKEKENALLKTENESKQLEIVYHKQQETIGWLAAASGLLLFIISVIVFFYRKKQLLYQAQLERVTAREDERQQIAKSLHDEVAGDLQLLHQKLKNSNLLEEAKKLDTVKENVRNLSHQLSSISFNKVSFKDQIINLVSDYFELDFRINITGLQEHNWQVLNDAINRLLYLSVRESIHNCKKHAKASKVMITFKIHKNHVFLQIEDNGIGFDANINKKGIGLQNLQERVEDLNGTLHIKSKIGNGTLTSIQIPLNAWTNKNTLS